MNKLIAIMLLVVLQACTQQSSVRKEADANNQRLEAVLAAQSEETQARYQYRHPKETLSFFEIQPGMTVMEALPGGGWYSKILLPYLGKDGHLIGVDYPADMWPKFTLASKKFIAKRLAWADNWPTETAAWNIPDAARASAYTFTTIPDDIAGTVDVVLFIRALHNLSRFEADGGYFSNAMQQAYKALKPGGTLGVVQHATTDASADGSTGYLERYSLISRIESHGFSFAAQSTINNNPNDSADGIVWRLPPSLATSKDDETLRKKFQAIGESNRMTIKFTKPK